MESQVNVKSIINPDADALIAEIRGHFARSRETVFSWNSMRGAKRVDLTAEEAWKQNSDLLNQPPPHLGLGAPVPKDHINGDSKRREFRSNDNLRRIMTGNKNALAGSKARDPQEKAKSAKRIHEESSSDEGGRSTVGKSKKAKYTNSSEQSSNSQRRVIMPPADLEKPGPQLEMKNESTITEFPESDVAHSGTFRPRLAELGEGVKPSSKSYAVDRKSLSGQKECTEMADPAVSSLLPSGKNATDKGSKSRKRKRNKL
jgi:hypothetical protein